jgi:hypothetical protein
VESEFEIFGDADMRYQYLIKALDLASDVPEVKLQMLRMLTNEIIPESIKVQVSGNEVPVTN